MESENEEQNLRCKLYQMDESEEWICLGIGFPKIQYNQVI